jgi:UDP-2-acetamido-2,6-beta-L-arabino-hexul-4-ose reductase
VHEDERGKLFETIKVHGTQFIAFSKPGVVRGNHFHRDKIEYFTVLQGEAVLYTRDKFNGNTHSYTLRGDTPETITVYPYWVHAIENVGDTEMILFVQGSEVFDPENTDTYPEVV